MSAELKKKVKEFLGHVASTVGLLERSFRSKLMIVTFHRVNDWMEEDGITCEPVKFEAFCKYFRDHFSVVSLAEQVAACREGRAMGGTLSITFDDGYRDNFEVAAPILRRLGLPATFFVTTGFIGTNFVPTWDQHIEYHQGWMTWDQVRALRAQRFDIGGHTETHIDMGVESVEVIRRELAGCRATLEAELGESATLFAYPFGGRQNISQASVDLVREAGFECCVSACGGVNAPLADPFHLNRINVGGWFSAPHQLGFEILSARV
jgi:peptidoglycan/xylan/chitin deacetylase (PgdA/CDA1 family)